MGQTSSNVVRKVGSWAGFGASPDNSLAGSQLVVSPFVYKRRSSLYKDEDGDIAHEFYEERYIDRKGRHRVMKKLKTNLHPVGDVDLPHPCLHYDLPIVLCDTVSCISSS